MPELLLATTNRGKLREIQSLLQGIPLNLLTPDMLGLELEVAEDGHTYAENAALKARAYARASGLISLADDSGLEVDCLGGEPGLHSARYSPLPDASDADRRALLLARLAGLPEPWTARFCCVVALALPDGQVFLAKGTCEGRVIPQERGQGGFGYDPIFYFPELGRTMAELTHEEKNQISHRALAVRAALPTLHRLLETGS
jgi:XTP/dITP diphosphohydrolase